MALVKPVMTNGGSSTNCVELPPEAACSPSSADSSGSSVPAPPAAATADQPAEEPVIDIVINNVVSSFSVRCHLDLRYIAMNGDNVEYRRENGMVTMKLRKPYATASMWSSGKITCTGSTSEAEAKVAARRVARYLQKQLNYQARFSNFRVVNVLGTCTMPFSIKIADFSQKYPRLACYEPELHPGVTFRIKEQKATLKVFSTGSITVTAPSVSNVQLAIEHIFPLVYEFRKERTPAEMAAAAAARARRHPSVLGSDEDENFSEEEEEEEDDEDEDLV